MDQLRRPLPPLPTNQGQPVILSYYNPKKKLLGFKILAGRYALHVYPTKFFPSMLGQKTYICSMAQQDESMHQIQFSHLAP